MLTWQFVTWGPNLPVPPVNFHQLESKFMKNTKGYEKYTTSWLLKTVDIEKDLESRQFNYALNFKEKFWKKQREKTTHGSAWEKDFVEYMLEEK